MFIKKIHLALQTLLLILLAYVFGLQPPECWIGKPVTDAFKVSH